MPDLSPDKILQTGFAFWASKTLLTAVDIGIFTELAREKQDLASLQSRFGFHRRSAADWMPRHGVLLAPSESRIRSIGSARSRYVRHSKRSVLGYAIREASPVVGDVYVDVTSHQATDGDEHA